MDFAPNLLVRASDSLYQLANGIGALPPWVMILAALPALLWLAVLWTQQKENIFMVCWVFLLGGLSVIPLFVLRTEIGIIDSWLGSSLAGTAIAVVVGALWVGLYEEWIKHVVAKKGESVLRSIDDAIMLAVVAALGFAFVENLWYFSRNLAGGGVDFWFVYTFRSLCSMLLHICASGIFGYFFGVALFANSVLQDDLKKGAQHKIVNCIHRALHVRSSTVFRSAKLFEGVLVATLLHGLFNGLLGLSTMANNHGNESLAKLFLAATIPLLAASFVWLFILLQKKEDHKNRGYLQR